MLNIGDNPMIPANWKKSPNAVFYRCDNTAEEDGVNGVGHCSFTKSPDGTEDGLFIMLKIGMMEVMNPGVLHLCNVLPGIQTELRTLEHR